MLQNNDSNHSPANSGNSGQLVTGGIKFSSSGEINIRVDGRAIGECMAQGFLQGLDSIEARKNKILAHEFSALELLSTADLVKELKRRQGVRAEEIYPHVEYRLIHGPVENVQIIEDTGPATILIVED